MTAPTPEPGSQLVELAITAEGVVRDADGNIIPPPEHKES